MKRTSAEDQWTAAQGRQDAQAGKVSLDPAQATEIVLFPPGAENPVFAIEQKMRPILVMTKDRLHIPCACGQRLHAVSSNLHVEGWQAAVHYRGICFSCGWQEAMYVVAHEQPTEDEIQMAEDVYALRRTA